MSADTDYPTKLAIAGQALGDTMRVYARGRLVLWMSKDWQAKSGSTHSKLDLNLLLDDSVTHVAIANPQHAPYGRAAEAALRKMKLLDRVRPKIVTAENVAQASQFVYSGSSDAGLVALTAVLVNKDAGGRWEIVPLDLYPPIDQAAVVTRHGQANLAAREFINYVTSAEGKAVLTKYGFGEPSKP
jgi:molybdate transport system substrate-binding protein